MKQWVPHQYQSALRDFALRHLAQTGSIRVNFWSGMGTGKTATTLSIIDILLTCGYANRILIVGPKRVASFTWPEEVASWSNFSHLRCVVAVGGKEQRLAAVASGAEIVTVNFDVLPKFVEECGKHFPFDVVVWDEATRLGSLRAATIKHHKTGKHFCRIDGAKQPRALAKKAFSHVKHWINLTGSPGGKGLEGIYGMCWPLDAGKRLGRSHTAFMARWFTTIQLDEDRTKVVPQPFAQDQIQALIKDITMVVEAKDFLDLPPTLESVVHVDLPPKAMTLYRQFEDEMFMEIMGDEVEAFNAAGVTNKCRQIANGSVIYDEDGSWHLIHDAKIEALRECIDEAAGEPVLVAYQFIADAQRILKAFPNAVKIDDDPETLRRFNRGEIDILLVHPLSAGHGISLHHACRTVVDFSTGWALEPDEQLLERVGATRQAQSGYNRTVYRRRIVARGTIEEVIVKRIRTKADVQQLLRDAMKERACS